MLITILIYYTIFHSKSQLFFLLSHFHFTTYFVIIDMVIEMEVIKITPQGFCKGVIRAIAIINKALDNPEIKKPIYMLGGLVHNKHIINAYQNKGIIIINNIDNIKSGTVIITAHGINKKVLAELNLRGLDIINATCFDVLKTHHLIVKLIKENNEIIYYGKHNHPETKGIMGIDDNIHLIENLDDIDNLNIDNPNIAFTTQTTMGYLDVLQIIDKLKQKFPHIKTYEEVCTSTKVRQNALLNAPKDIDLFLVVGDPTSNNTNKLKELGEKHYSRCIMIENANDLNKIDLQNVKRVAVTSGASTPPAIVNEIIKALKNGKYETNLTNDDYLNYRKPFLPF